MLGCTKTVPPHGWSCWGGTGVLTCLWDWGELQAKPNSAAAMLSLVSLVLWAHRFLDHLEPPRPEPQQDEGSHHHKQQQQWSI